MKKSKLIFINICILNDLTRLSLNFHSLYLNVIRIKKIIQKLIHSFLLLNSESVLKIKYAIEIKSNPFLHNLYQPLCGITSDLYFEQMFLVRLAGYVLKKFSIVLSTNSLILLTRDAQILKCMSCVC